MREPKLFEPAPARLLYRSEWFTKVRALVETQKADWLILSALYGVVAPNTCISPYEKTLNSAGVAERRAWAENARRQLAPSLIGRRRVVIFAGQRYSEFLVPALLSDGYGVDVPMANLGIGEQLATELVAVGFVERVFQNADVNELLNPALGEEQELSKLACR